MCIKNNLHVCVCLGPDYFTSILSTKLPPDVFYKKGVRKNFAEFTGKHLCQSLFFNKVRKETQALVFSCTFAKFRITPFSQNTSWRLLL